MKRTFAIPVRLTVLIEIEMDSDIPEDDNADGKQVVNLLEEDYTGELKALMDAAKDLPEFDDAVDNLCAAIHMHRRSYPSTKAYLSTFAGITEEVEL